MQVSLRLVFLLVGLAAGYGAAQEPAPAAGPADGNRPPAVPEVVAYRYQVIASYPHDWRAFTQGLVYEDGFLYEGTGLYGRSAIYRRNLKTGQALKVLRLPDKYFGEGITLFGDTLIELTWKSKIGFIYRKDTFTPRGQFRYSTEGWGLTHDGKRLIMSDGTTTLHFLDPNTYAETGRMEVTDRGRPVWSLNELEFIPAAASAHDHPDPNSPDAQTARGEIPTGVLYANVWPTDRIAIIDLKTGHVTGWIDMVGLYPRPRNSDAVLNGIAWLPESGHLLITGKLWPRIYEIELIPEASAK